MEPGVNGQPGAAVLRPAEKEEKPALESATILQPRMEERSVLVNQLNRQNVL